MKKFFILLSFLFCLFSSGTAQYGQSAAVFGTYATPVDSGHVTEAVTFLTGRMIKIHNPLHIRGSYTLSGLTTVLSGKDTTKSIYYRKLTHFTTDSTADRYGPWRLVSQTYNAIDTSSTDSVYWDISLSAEDGFSYMQGIQLRFHIPAGGTSKMIRFDDVWLDVK